MFGVRTIQHSNPVCKYLLTKHQYVSSLSSRISQPYFAKDIKCNSTCTRLKGKVAIVTASTEGNPKISKISIGYAVAKRLGEEGANIVVSSRKAEKVKNATKSLKELGLNVLGLTCHVSKEEDRKHLVEKTLEAFGGIDILISNAAVNPYLGGVLECPGPAWDKVFEVNVKNALELTQVVVPHIRKRNGGAVVYVSSIAGFQPFKLLGPYSVSKTTLLGLTKVVAQEVAVDNIRVNCIVPGLIKTKFSLPLFSNDEIVDKALGSILLKGDWKPDDISGVVAFLCSDDARFITGENIVAAGGMPSRL